MSGAARTRQLVMFTICSRGIGTRHSATRTNNALGRRQRAESGGARYEERAETRRAGRLDARRTLFGTHLSWKPLNADAADALDCEESLAFEPAQASARHQAFAGAPVRSYWTRGPGWVPPRRLASRHDVAGLHGRWSFKCRCRCRCISLESKMLHINLRSDAV